MRRSTGRARDLLAPVLVLALSAAGLTACDTPPPPDPCAWTTQAPKSGLGRTVVMVDVSASFRDAPGSGTVRDPRDAVAEYVRRAVRQKRTVSVAAFDGHGPTGVHWLKPRSTDWAAEDGNPDGQEQLRKDAVDCIQKDVAAAARTTAAKDGTDVLAAIRAAGGALHDVRGRRELIVVSDGLATTGCADLTRSLFQEHEEIDAILRVCRNRKELRDGTLTGVRTVFTGLGQPAVDQPVPTAAQQQWLVDLWTVLCARSHARSDRRARCDIAGTQLAVRRTAGTSGTRVTAAADPAVTFGDGHRQRYRLPGAALFDTNSATLRPGAKDTLAEIAVAARSVPGARVRVDGYVDPRGDRASDGPLSQARADAVGDQLRELGVDKVTSRGRGLAPGCPGRAASAGADRLQCDRRVDIEVVT
ncbi:OmpA family protein [Streptomyces sp. cg35]|uniref:OmpA family protein n=1 Tax=Streptomyces sp. cg35 TaxID=3421650 RepID=UPI003D17E36E